MKYTSLFFLGIVFLLASCKKSCTGCNANQVCNNGICQCKDWFEGANCETAMSAKYSGTFIGRLYQNGLNLSLDTIVLRPDTISGRYSFSQTGSSPAFSNNVILSLQNSTQAIFGIAVATQIFDASVNCGTATISHNGINLTVSYSPLTNNGIPNPDTIITFIGTKQ